MDNKATIAAAFNEWMRRYTEEPESFQREFEAVGEFLKEQAEGREPSYGEACTDYLASLIAEADGGKKSPAVPIPAA